MKKILKYRIHIITLICLCSIRCRADHIAGGNLELKGVKNSPNHYLIRIILLRDNAGGTEPDPSEAVTIFRKRDNFMMRYEFNINFSTQSRRSVPFTNRTCAVQRNLELSEYVYEKELILDPETYNDPQGYYIVWNGCCRNNGIDNIELPGKSIMTFYLEFPALQRNGKPFTNSSPSFDLINGEYACYNQPFKYEFDAKDADGDELRYSISSPIMGVPLKATNTQLSIPYPGIGMSDFPTVKWLPGYEASNAIPGKGQPSLSIDRNGSISVTPNKLGLFLFGVTVEEYRNGQKIGMVKRDYQIFVIDCPLQEPPQTSLTIEGYPGQSEVTVCKGKELILKAENNPTWYYQWQKDGLNISGANQFSYKATEPGIYDVEVSFKGQCGRTRSSKSVRINIIGKNSKLSASGSTAICKGGKVHLTATGDSTFAFIWFKDGLILGVNKKKIEALEAGSYYASITDPIQQCTTQTDTVEVSNDSVERRIDFSEKGKSVICPNGNTILKIDPISNATYQWYRNKQLLSNNVKPNLEVKSDGNYHVVVKDLSSGCNSYSDTLHIAVKNMPSIMLNAEKNILCLSDSTRLTASPFEGYTFEIFKNDINIAKTSTKEWYTSTTGTYTFRGKDADNCEVVSNPVSISVVQKIEVNLDSIQGLCGINNPAIKLKGSPSGGFFKGVGVTGDIFDPKVAGIGQHQISYVVESQHECQNGTKTRVAIILQTPYLKLGNDKELWKGSSIGLNGDIGDQYNYEWIPSDYLSSSNLPDPVSKPEKDISYVLKVTNALGCSTSDSITIRVFQRISIPEAFTPNGDGVNDKWELKGIDAYPNAELTVFNRWGTPIYHTIGYNDLFDGTYQGVPLEEGQYPFVLRYSENTAEIKGNVFIVR